MRISRLAWLMSLLALLSTWALGAPAGLETLSVGTAPSATATLEWVAEDRGYFKAEGLRVDFRDYSSGKEALDDVLLGKVDVAAVSPIPLAILGFEQEG